MECLYYISATLLVGCVVYCVTRKKFIAWFHGFVAMEDDLEAVERGRSTVEYTPHSYAAYVPIVPNVPNRNNRNTINNGGIVIGHQRPHTTSRRILATAATTH